MAKKKPNKKQAKKQVNKSKEVLEVSEPKPKKVEVKVEVKKETPKKVAKEKTVLKPPVLDGGMPKSFTPIDMGSIKIELVRFAQPVKIDNRPLNSASADLRGGGAYVDMVIDNNFLHIKSRKTQKTTIVPIGNIIYICPFE